MGKIEGEKSPVLKLGSGADLSNTLELAAQVIRSGGLVAYPTESYYGLGANAMDDEAIRRLFAVKGRPAGRPILILIPSVEDLGKYAAEIPSIALRLIEAFWPGGLTMVFDATPAVSPLLTAGTGKVGIRVSGHPVSTGLSRAVGNAITGTSANPSGASPCSSAREVLESIGKGVDLILDGGKTEGQVGSTVLDVTVHPPQVLRAGMVPESLLREFIGA